jgi:hypothetical protein
MGLRRQPVTVDHHSLVKPPNDVASGSLEQERAHGVHQTREASREHVHREAEGMAPVLQVGLFDVPEVTLEIAHGQGLYPIFDGILLRSALCFEK